MIAIGSDHGGFELKGHIIEHLKEHLRHLHITCRMRSI